MTAAALWRRLDVPGHDACRLRRAPDAWHLEGTAVFTDDRSPVCLSYGVSCDSSWLTRSGYVKGWHGAEEIDFSVIRDPEGTWSFNGRAIAGLEDCADLDLGFTPATNLIHLRRVSLPVGASTEIPVAWLDASSVAPRLVSQTYLRTGDSTYDYRSPAFGYAATLVLDRDGFVRDYPGLWLREV